MVEANEENNNDNFFQEGGENVFLQSFSPQKYRQKGKLINRNDISIFSSVGCVLKSIL